ncbi:MAG TPA: short-chain dehydrogenase, partial [Flavobacteriales bacterium]|nr:short-chain dehydrogenase [Flavobacteriales bacterium]
MKASNDFALVTGSASGLGRSVLTSLAARKFNIIGVSRPGDNVEAVVETIAKQFGVIGIGIELDLSV